MARMIFLAPASLCVVTDADTGVPLGSLAGGCLLQAAMKAGSAATLVTELTPGPVGDAVGRAIADSGTGLQYVERLAEGNLALRMIYARAPGEASEADYAFTAPVPIAAGAAAPEDAARFDVAWPRMDRGDVVAFGEYLAVDPQARGHLLPLLQHARDIGARLVYYPGPLRRHVPRVTRIMPAVLENLELADLVVGRLQDLNALFGGSGADAAKDAAALYRDHVTYYDAAMVCLDPDRTLTAYDGADSAAAEGASACATMMWDAGALAAIAGLMAGSPQAPTPAQLVSAAASGGDQAIAALPAWQLIEP